MKYLYLLFIGSQIIGQAMAQSKLNEQNGQAKHVPVVKNVLGTPLAACCFEPLTGYFRDGFCNTNADDYGTHTVCAIMSEAFLTYTLSKGNDLSTPKPQYNFLGLKPGDKWCLCALRWYEAYKAGVAPKLILAATHQKTLEFVPLEVLQEHEYKE